MHFVRVLTLAIFNSLVVAEFYHQNQTFRSISTVFNLWHWFGVPLYVSVRFCENSRNWVGL